MSKSIFVSQKHIHSIFCSHLSFFIHLTSDRNSQECRLRLSLHFQSIDWIYSLFFLFLEFLYIVTCKCLSRWFAASSLLTRASLWRWGWGCRGDWPAPRVSASPPRPAGPGRTCGRHSSRYNSYFVLMFYMVLYFFWKARWVVTTREYSS